MIKLFLLFLVSTEAFGGALQTSQFSLNQEVRVTVTSAAAGQQVLGENLNRGYLFIQNPDTAATLTLSVLNAPSGLNGVTIPPNGGGYEFLVVPTDAIFLSSSVDNTSAVILEGRAR